VRVASLSLVESLEVAPPASNVPAAAGPAAPFSTDAHLTRGAPFSSAFRFAICGCCRSTHHASEPQVFLASSDALDAGLEVIDAPAVRETDIVATAMRKEVWPCPPRDGCSQTAPSAPRA
jgi:hypothetical protein